MTRVDINSRMRIQSLLITYVQKSTQSSTIVDIEGRKRSKVALDNYGKYFWGLLFA